MNRNWEQTTFGELIRSGVLLIGDGYRAMNSELGGSGLIFLRAGHVTDTCIDLTGVERFWESLSDRVSGKMAQPKDVVITTKGNSTGRTTYITHNLPPLVYSPHLSFWRSLNPDYLLPEFLRYWAQGWEFQHQLEAFKASTDMAPYLSLADQKRLRITLPPPSEQRAIADVLSALDDKIELNRRMNETLEAMARALFKSWFVDFDPARARAEGRVPEGVGAETAALFPDSFESSELGEIPKDWKAGTLGDVAVNPRHGVHPEEVEPDIPYIGLEHMPRGSIALGEWGTARDVSSGKFRFHKGEILFGKLRPYFHKVGFAIVDGVCSTDILVVAPKESIWHGFVLSHLSSDKLIQYVTAATTGTRMPRTNWNDLAGYKIAVPTEAVAKAFNHVISSFLQKIENNIWQSRALAETRDALLPKLMSGEIRVKP